MQQVSLSGTWGLAGVIPILQRIDQEYMHRFEFDASDYPDPSKAEGEWRVVAFVTRHHGPSGDREVLNATEHGLMAVDVKGVSEADFRITGLYPQPLHGVGSLQLQLDRAARLRITVTDLLGRETLLDQGDFTTGMHTLTLSTSSLRPGMYHLRVSDGRRMLTRTFVVM